MRTFHGVGTSMVSFFSVVFIKAWTTQNADRIWGVPGRWAPITLQLILYDVVDVLPLKLDNMSRITIRRISRIARQNTHLGKYRRTGCMEHTVRYMYGWQMIRFELRWRAFAPRDSLSPDAYSLNNTGIFTASSSPTSTGCMHTRQCCTQSLVKEIVLDVFHNWTVATSISLPPYGTCHNTQNLLMSFIIN